MRRLLPRLAGAASDGLEASFTHTEGLLVLLEGIGGRRWWQENQTQIEARVMTLAAGI